MSNQDQAVLVLGGLFAFGGFILGLVLGVWGLFIGAAAILYFRQTIADEFWSQMESAEGLDDDTITKEEQ